MASGKSASGIFVVYCCIVVAILVVNNEVYESEAVLSYTSECQEACKKVEQRSAQGCLVRCMYRCMPVVGAYSRCHPSITEDNSEAKTEGNGQASASFSGSATTSTTRKIKS